MNELKKTTFFNLNYLFLSLAMLCGLVDWNVQAQVINPFTIRYQTSQKGGLRFISNASVTCNSSTTCTTAKAEVPPAGTGQNNNFTMSYIDIDGDAGTYMSSSDSLNLANCSEILWAGLYWGAKITTSTTNYANRSNVKLKVNNNSYTVLSADQTLSYSGTQSYFCFKNITSIVQSAGIKARFTVADLVTQTNSTNLWGGWTIVVAYKNTAQSYKNITVFDGLANVSQGTGSNTVTIPVSGFLTPISGAVNFELGVVAYDGDRNQTGDQLLFNGVGTNYVQVTDALHNATDMFNSTIAYGGVLTPFRNPSNNNNLGYDATIYLPNNATQNYLGNNATSANIRVTTSSETIITRVLTSAIDIYEPDLRASVTVNDLNGGAVVPGDILEYTVTGKNIGSDVSINTFITDTLDIRTTYVPNSITYLNGPFIGSKTDVASDDQAEYDAVNRVVKMRVGTGATATLGGQMLNSVNGADSSVVRFRVQVANDCLILACDSTLENKAYIYGTGVLSGSTVNNGGASDVYDALGCATSANNLVTINTSGCPVVDIGSNPPLCIGDTLHLTTLYSQWANYAWTGPNGFSSTVQNPSIPNLTNNNAGTYALNITFTGSTCTFSNLTEPVVIHPTPLINLINLTNSTCYNSDNGTITVGATGGQPINYTWSNGNTSTTVNNLSPGLYTVTVQDSYTCVNDTVFPISEPDTLVSNISITSNYHGQNISCYNATDGSAAATATGGTLPYTYLWSNGQTSATATGLAAGTYTVTVTDAHGCVSTKSVTLTQPTAIVLNTSFTPVLCFGGSTGSVSLSATGGTFPYTYIWSNGQITQNLNGLSAGTYSVQVADVNGCLTTIQTTVTQPSAPLNSQDTHADVLCYAGSTGSIDLTVSGGTPTYSYSWNTGATTQDLSNLPIGSYEVVITDMNNCTSQYTVSISQPVAPLSISGLVTPIGCLGQSSGAINIGVSGGTLPYVYSWSNGSSLQNISSLPSGNYSVLITDSHNCTLTSSYTIIEPLSPLALSETHNDIYCFGAATGNINVTAVGGTTPYSFAWSNFVYTEDLTSIPAGTYQLQVEDANGCQDSLTVTLINLSNPILMSEVHTNVLCFGDTTGTIDLTVSGGAAPFTYLWNNGSTVEDIANVSGGTYSVIAYDANNCSDTLITTIVQPSSGLNLTETHTNASCMSTISGSIDLTVTGGVPAYAYSWNNGATTQDITGLSSGTYVVQVTDNNACVSNLTVIVIDPSNTVVVTALVDSVNCFGGADGSINLSPSGGMPGYVFDWSTGAIAEDLTNLSPGNYFVNVDDVLGCGLFMTFTVGQPSSPLTVTGQNNNVICFGQQNGVIDLTVSGGTPGYSFIWTNGQTTEDLSNLTAGTYSGTIHDANGCSQSYVGQITEPGSSLTINLTSTPSLCFGGTSGSVNLTVNGGVPSYTYSWSNGSTTEDLSNVGAGTYTVTVQDQNGCLMSGSIVVGQPASALTLSQTTTHVSCYGGNNGYINLSVIGGTPAYSYLWNNAATTEDLSNISSGGYSVVVTDANGCTSNLSVLVNQPSSLVSVSGTVSNVLCYGGTTGSISSVGQGGTSPYSYAWSNGETTSQVTGLSAGLYTVTVSDANGCTANQTWSVTQPSALSLQSTNTNILCYGQSSGSITSQASGGVTPYTYTWTNGMTGQNILNVPAGPYFVTVVDGNGCSATFSDTVYQPTTALTLSTSIVNNNCFGAATGSIDNTVTGGTSPYQYQWNTSATTQDLTNLLAGTYVLTIMDANGCLLNNSLQVTQPPISIVSSLSQVNVSCLGGGNGSINLTATGTGAPFTYLWNNGSTTEDISGLVPGVYSVTITDNSGCTTSMSANITQPATSVSLQSLVTNVLCTGNNTGSIDLTVNGGTTPYFYSWSNGNGTQDLTNVIAGTYSVIVTDAKGCQANMTAQITQPTSALSVLLNPTQIACHSQATGTIDLIVSGGTVNYTYAWSNNATVQDLASVPAGFYSVVVTDANGCTATTSTTLSQPAQSLLVSGIVTNVSCFGNANGSIDVTATGGTAPYNYIWSNGAYDQDIDTLLAGTYVLQVYDDNGCFSQTSYQVTQATQPLALSTVMTPEGCYGGNNGGLDLSVVGGTSPFTYAWTGPSGYTATIQDLLNVYTGIYNVTVTDANGCSAQLSDTVSEPAAYALSHVITNVDCFGNSTGAVNLTVNGGTPGYAYNWNNGTTTQDLSGILSGTYSVVVTDANGCTLHDTVSITQPGFATTLSSVVSNVSCQGGLNGSINLTVVSANTGLAYLWNNQAVSEDISNLGAGTYTVTVTDANGCVNTLSSTVTQPSVLTLSSTTINPLCTDSLNGSIDLTVNGGTSPYTYLWNTTATTEDISGLLEGTYFVTVTDTNGCSATSSIQLVDPSPISSSYTSLSAQCNGGTNGSVNVTVSGGTPGYSYVWSNGPTTEDLSNVGAGTYTLTITDNHGCTHTQLATVGQPSNPITLSAAITNIGCFGTSTGAIDLTVTGGTPNYTYSWGNGMVTQDLVNMNIGSYDVMVYDANGCFTNATYTISQPTNPLTLSITGNNITCYAGNNGSVDLTINGGQAPYSINWNTNATTEDLINLTAGTYSVTVVDANNCSMNASIVLIAPVEPLTITSAVLTNVTCFNQSTGSINLSISGGSFPYSYAWSNNATSQDLLNIPAGGYSVSITDFNGCTTSGTYSITQPSSGAVISYNVQDVSCNGGTNGSINVNVVGGTLPYTYFWTNNAATTQDLFGIGAGSYTLNVYDDSSCVTVATISVNQPIQAVTPSTVISAVSCYGFSNGSIDLSVVGGTPGYTYVWNTGATTQDISGLVSGTYTVTITDANGCVSTHSYVVTQPSAPLTLNTSQVNVLCYGNASGFINLITTGGTSPYSYAWSNAATTEDIFNLLAGTYSVDVTDLNGCTASTQVTITQPAAGISLQETHVNVTCYGANNGSIDITPSGGTPGTSPAYSYLWSNTATTQDITSLIAGTYTVLVTDNVGCSYTQSIVVSQPLAPLVATPTITNLICYGVPEGAIDITISGGTAPYVYYWNTGATTQDLSNLAAGSYSLAVTDANNCVTSIVVAVSEPASPLTVTYFATPASCYGYADGTVMLNITGGAPSYDILWSNGDTTNFIDSLLAGTYSAQITDANGCDAVINAIISQPQALIADFNIDATFGCAPLTVNLLNTSVGTIASSTWNFGNGSVSTSNNASYTYTQGGCYGISLTVMSPTGCLATTSIDSLVCVVTGPSAGFAATTTDIDYFTGQLELVNTSQGAITNYMWSFGDGSPNSTLENPIHYYPEETVDSYIVSLMVTDTNGCTDTVTHLFWLNEMLNVYVPNAITVTNDGLNEVFLPVFSNVDAVKDYDLWIYNRWGQLVFETDEIAEGWNGRYKDNKDVQLGVYTWKIRYVDNLGVAKTIVGHVTILR